MENVIFKKLTLLSHKEKSAAQFTFGQKNLILSPNNAVGKSTLIRMIFWSLGCEPFLSSEWDSLKCQSILEFIIGDKLYCVGRRADASFYLFSNGEWKKYDKVTGQFSIDISKIFGMEFILFQNKKDKLKLENPTPAFLINPFYINQDGGWNSKDYYNGFSNLNQYDKKQRDVVLNYLTGYLNSDILQLIEKINEIEILKSKESSEKHKLSEMEAKLTELLPFSLSNQNLIDDFIDDSLANFSMDLNNLLSQREKNIQQLAEKQNQFFFLNNQLKIMKGSVSNLEENYIYAVEYCDKEYIECPVCGVKHDNSLASRAELLLEKSKIEDEINALSQALPILKDDIQLLNQDTQNISEQIKKLEEVNIYFMNNSINISQLIGYRTMSNNIHKKITEHSDLLVDYEDEVKKLKREKAKEQKKINEEGKEISHFFYEKLQYFSQKLDVDLNNIENVTEPKKYKELTISGAESSRATLAYYLAVWETMAKNNACFFPIIIDTPNQQEQQKANYDLILMTLNEFVSKTKNQIFICALDTQNLIETNFKQDANVILLNENKILSKDNYQKFIEDFKFMSN